MLSSIATSDCILLVQNCSPSPDWTPMRMHQHVIRSWDTGWDLHCVGISRMTRNTKLGRHAIGCTARGPVEWHCRWQSSSATPHAADTKCLGTSRPKRCPLSYTRPGSAAQVETTKSYEPTALSITGKFLLSHATPPDSVQSHQHSFQRPSPSCDQGMCVAVHRNIPVNSFCFFYYKNCHRMALLKHARGRAGPSPLACSSAGPQPMGLGFPGSASPAACSWRHNAPSLFRSCSFAF